MQKEQTPRSLVIYGLMYLLIGVMAKYGLLDVMFITLGGFFVGLAILLLIVKEFNL